MNHKFTAFVLIAAYCLAATAIPVAFAQEGRFVMERTESGFVRLDTFTGEMSVCTEAESQIVCRMAADERRALEDEIDVLEERIEELEQQMATLPDRESDGLPSEEEIDRTFGIMEQMMRRFFGMIEEFEQEREDPGREEPDPERT